MSQDPKTNIFLKFSFSQKSLDNLDKLLQGQLQEALTKFSDMPENNK
jgi:hypothetical protein